MSWKPQDGKPALVMVEGVEHDGFWIKTPHGKTWCALNEIVLSEPPTPITPEERAVVDAAKEQAAVKGRPHSFREAESAVARTNEAVRALRASEAPPDPKAELLAAAKTALHEFEDNECHHESTRRGGIIWTFCDDCGKKWADDQGGFKPYCEPAHITNLRAAIRAMEADDDR